MAAVGAAVLVPSTADARPAPPGADVPFTTYEAESAATNGARIGPGNAFTRIEAEASGRRAVALKAGQYVEFTLAERADAVNVRYSVADGSPDAPLHVSAGGRSLTDLTLTARYSHVYGNYPYTNDPADGGEHHYFNDVHALLGRTLPAGTRVRFTATAPVVVDLADFEQAGPAREMPAGYLSAAGFGADPTGAADSGPAIQAAIDAGAAQGRGVWLPAGTYQVHRQLVVDKVTVKGAGPWYTVLRGSGVGVFGRFAPTPSSDVHLADFAIAGDTTVRDDSTSDSGLGGSLGGGSTVDNVWIEHTKVGMWFDGPVDGLTVSHARVQDTMADGINLHNGVSHTTIRDTFVRNTGDDGMAMWSDANADHDNAFVHDTVAVPLLANGFAVYGGRDNAVTDSVASDAVTQGGGIHVGNRFGAVPLSGTTTIARNVLLRDGNLVPNAPEEIGALWFYAADAPMTGAIDVHDVSIVDSPFSAVQFYGKAISNVTLERVAIVKAGTFAVQLQAPGSAKFTAVVATGVGAAGRYDCASGFNVVRGPGDAGWSSTRCGFPPAGALRLSAGTLDFGQQALHATGSQQLTIANPGPDPITIRAVRATDGYTVGGFCATIPVGGSCTVPVAFAPARAGVYNGKLTIDSTSPAGPYVVALHGVGFDPDGNLALGQQITSSSQALSWLGPANLVDGDPGTYFESANNAFPQTVTLDLGAARSVDRIVLRLPANWGGRAETIAVAADGAALVPAADYELNPDTGNAVTIAFPATTVRTLTLTFTGNTGWPAAQLSELEVYAH
ncbi:choice-of-anchor D domain-containing protein [Dactylosporangium sp. CA-139066]|uniref:choice-of-anchor D domain-containing protein n=1 Tax=Dactylosporangium sp. CA-139066 TaxID=3239930 RepID=UPI003D8BEDB0